MNSQVEDEMALISQYYPGIYTQLAPQQGGEAGGEAKPRRRRKKSKGEASGREIRKRKLSQEQVDLLEMNFGSEHKLDSERKDRLASELGLDPRQVAVWFQNRRARWKTKKLEEEYSKLKSQHETTLLEKCRLDTEVLRLKDQLSEMEKEMQRLSLLERCDGASSNSSSSSLSVEAMEPPFLGGFGMEGMENIFYVPENNYLGMEWVNLM